MPVFDEGYYVDKAYGYSSFHAAERQTARMLNSLNTNPTSTTNSNHYNNTSSSSDYFTTVSYTHLTLPTICSV